MMFRFQPLTSLVVACALGIAGCGNSAVRPKIYEHRGQSDVLRYLDSHQPTVLAGDKRLSFPEMLAALADRRVVFVGEMHERYDHHLTQLAVVQGLYAQTPKLAIGMEWFQQPFQRHLDDYTAGRIDERELLLRTEYYERWRYDFRMVRPILQFAREHGLPLVALNAPVELTRKVGANGLESLSAEERAQLPNPIHPAGDAYAKRLRAVLQEHEGRNDAMNFLTVQRVWDETMAGNARRFLESHPDYRMAVLAGIGHVSFKEGIPADLTRELPVKIATVTSNLRREAEPGLVDYYALTEPATLPPSGLLGVFLEHQGDGMVIKELPADSPLQKAGANIGERIVAIQGNPVGTLTDIKLALMERRPGDTVKVSLKAAESADAHAREVEISLLGPPQD